MDTMPPDLTGLRNEYAAHGLRRADLHSDPLQQFGAWFAAALAADIRDVNAMSLATATSRRQTLRPHRFAQRIR